MKLSSAVSAILILVLTLVGISAASSALAGTYKLDPDHSFVYFKIAHMGVTRVIGRFDDVSGTLAVDDQSGMLQSAAVDARTGSVNTGVARRDTHLTSPDFFNAAQFPQLHFALTSVVATDSSHFDLNGNVTLHGVTHPVDVAVVQLGTVTDAQGQKHIGTEATFTIKRSDFGMTGMQGLIGDDVQISLDFDAVKQ